MAAATHAAVVISETMIVIIHVVRESNVVMISQASH
jgi:hypothetical protein